MSDSEDDFVEYGSALEPLDEDAIPRKRPLTLEDQVVKDAQGRRRFHGAFTGGFSAGFFNTVGSLEGWTPSSFKSSRSERMESKSQRPEDFMDDEDTGEFGIAPRVLRATHDFNHLKRNRERAPRSSDGPIPGEPVLKLLLQPVRETAGVRLLRRMGWRPGQGVGPRVSAPTPSRRPRVMGCAPPPGLGAEQPSSSEEEDDEDAPPEGITFAPEDVPAFLCRPKADTFGLGYQGLDRRPVLSQGVGPAPAAATTIARPVVLGGGRGGAVTVTGQAFGVGAMEEEDDDIYAQEDMSQYDFALGGPNSSRSGHKPSAAQAGETWLENFTKAMRAVVKEFFPPPALPRDYQPVHVPRRSRFDQPPQASNAWQAPRTRTAIDRAAIVGGSAEGDEEEEEVMKERQRLRAEALKLTEGMPAIAGSGDRFVPFAGHPDKQRRYEQFLALLRAKQPDKLFHLQPLSMNEWERQREKREFEQAARLFRPLSADMGERFVCASQPDDATDPTAQVEKFMNATSEQRNAAKMKMFGRMTREEEPWQPCDLLCKRFNIAKPSVSNVSSESKNRKKASIFDFLKAASHNTVLNKPPDKMPIASTSFASTSDSTLQSVDSKIVIAEKESAAEIERNESKFETEAKESNSEVEVNESKSVDEPSAESTSLTGKKEDSPEEFLFPEPVEKVDLFKAIFLSSSESEEEEEEEEKPNETSSTKNEKETAQPTELSHFVASAPAASTVVVQNVPKRPSVFASSAKSGVFANLDLDALSHPITSMPTSSTSKVPEPQLQKANTSTPQLDKSMYGPRLPAIPPAGTPSAGRTLSSVVAPPQPHSPLCEWVESTSVHKNKKEKKKKEKRHKDKKSKHKKHKHKK